MYGVHLCLLMKKETAKCGFAQRWKKYQLFLLDMGIFREKNISYLEANS